MSKNIKSTMKSFFCVKSQIFFALIFFVSQMLFAEQKQSFATARPNPWSLIIYRPDNNYEMNDIRCWLKLIDAETGEDVTYKKAKAKYEWVSCTQVVTKGDPTNFFSMFKGQYRSTLYKYQKSYYLSGGMAMHLNLQAGKYIISVCTPKKDTNLFQCENDGDWFSNEFYYDTANPTNVIFVCPTADKNGIYNGGWHIDYRAPKFWLFTTPLMDEN